MRKGSFYHSLLFFMRFPFSSFIVALIVLHLLPHISCFYCVRVERTLLCNMLLSNTSQQHMHFLECFLRCPSFQVECIFLYPAHCFFHDARLNTEADTTLKRTHLVSDDFPYLYLYTSAANFMSVKNPHSNKCSRLGEYILTIVFLT